MFEQDNLQKRLVKTAREEGLAPKNNEEKSFGTAVVRKDADEQQLPDVATRGPAHVEHSLQSNLLGNLGLSAILALNFTLCS